MARKRVDPKAKKKKQAIILVVGLVVLAGVLAFQLPRMMKTMNGQSAAAPAPAPSTVDTGGSAPVGGTELVESPLVPAPGQGQLVSFSLFESKDPFVQQVETDEEGAVPGDPGVPPAVPEGELPPLPPTVPEGDPGTPTVPTDPSTPDPEAAASATISVNGVSEVVKVKGDFPAAEPLFTLVSLTADTAEIAIAGGEYDDGAATVTLQKGKTVTLMNTVDGSRYELLLVSVG